MDRILNHNSYAIDRLFRQVVEKASSKPSKNKGSKDAFLDCVSHVIRENLTIDESKLKNIESVQFKPGTQVPMDFYIHIGIGDAKIEKSLTEVLVSKLKTEGYLQDS